MDIKAEAIEIAKLRLWLSLVVDTERAQVEPLPNLDYKLMQGNSLIETLDGQPILAPELPQQRMTLDGQGVLPNALTTQLTLGMSDTDQTLKVLRDLKDKYFTAEPRARAKLRERIHQQETQIVLTHLRQRQADLEARQKALVQNGSQVNWRGMSDAKKQIDAWQAAWQKLEDLKAEIRAGAALPFFLYRLHFGEVFSDRGGFDIVIANPPYVRQELIKSQKTVLEKSFPTIYEGTADLYVYFYARGLDLLRPTGILAFISSNKFMRAEYGTRLRGLLAEQTTIQRVIDFGDLPVFKATTYSCTVITRKVTPSQHHTPTLLRLNDIEALEHLEGEIERKAQRVPQNELRSDVWILRGSEIARLMSKILAAGQPLSANAQVKFFNGVKTGLNDAFVIDRQMRVQLIEEHATSKDLIKPWLQGKNINRWAIHDAGEFILYITWDCPIDHHPAIKSYLSRFRKALEHRDSVVNGSCPWYALSRPRAENEWVFSRSKIAWPNLCTLPKFANDAEVHYISAPANVLWTEKDAAYLLGILNSWVTHWLMTVIAAERAGNFIEYKPVYVSQLPVPDTSSFERQAIRGTVRQLLDLRGEGAIAANLERELNERVYRLFGLMPEEIALVERALARE